MVKYYFSKSLSKFPASKRNDVANSQLFENALFTRRLFISKRVSV